MPRSKRRRRGSGSIFQRKGDGRWVATISSGPRDTRQVRSAYRRTRAEAEEALRELLARHGPLKASRLTVSDYLARWVRDARDIRPTTRRGYDAVVRTHLMPELGAVHLADLTPLHVEAMLARLAPTMAPKTLRNIHVVLRRALGQAVRADLIERNPASREFVDVPKSEAPEPDALSPDELAKLHAVLPGHPLEAHVVLALTTGLRSGEQRGLAWQDVDLDAGRLTVRYALARVDGSYRRVDPKTPRSRRVLPLAPAVVEVLRAHRSRLIAAGFTPVATGPVFPNATGGPLNDAVLTHRWYDLLAQAGIRRRPWKVLRATFGSRLFAEGVPDRVIADLLGHARSYTTHRHYISTGPVSGDVVEAMGRLAG